MPKTYYQVTQLNKRSVKDNYEEGEIGTTLFSDIGVTFKADTKNDVIKEVCDSLDVTVQSACPDEEYTEIMIVTRMEDRAGDKASINELDEWKDGRLELWSAYYSFSIYKIVEETVKFS